MATLEEWYEYSERLRCTAVRMFETLQPPLGENRHVVALALLARTLSSFESAMLLVRNGRVVDARTLVRSCYENLFYVAGVAAQGDSFIRKMFADHLAAQKDRGEQLLGSRAIERGSEVEEKLRTYLKSLRGHKGRSLDPKGIAANSTVSHGYAIYMQLSADAAHPSIISLSRHVLRNAQTDDVDEFNVAPIPDPLEVIDTIDFACGALLGLCFGTGEVLGGSDVALEIKQRMTELRQLKGLIE